MSRAEVHAGCVTREETERLREWLHAAEDKLGKVAALLVQNGCDCTCDHCAEDHDDECERCFACLVGEAIG